MPNCNILCNSGVFGTLYLSELPGFLQQFASYCQYTSTHTLKMKRDPIKIQFQCLHLKFRTASTRRHAGHPPYLSTSTTSKSLLCISVLSLHLNHLFTQCLHTNPDSCTSSFFYFILQPSLNSVPSLHLHRMPTDSGWRRWFIWGQDAEMRRELIIIEWSGSHAPMSCPAENNTFDKGGGYAAADLTASLKNRIHYYTILYEYYFHHYPTWSRVRGAVAATLHPLFKGSKGSCGNTIVVNDAGYTKQWASPTRSIDNAVTLLRYTNPHATVSPSGKFGRACFVTAQCFEKPPVSRSRDNHFLLTGSQISERSAISWKLYKTQNTSAINNFPVFTAT